ncbi:MAG: efflux RND transporter permease subunit [Deltaproteobacteria bacterium]|nr:efflux RND transporter permease subunit [Deltaproteobacteria bacterium]
MWLSRLSVSRPVLATMVAIVLMLLGLIGLGRLPLDTFPDVSTPIVSVIVPYPGADPGQVERDVVRPVEDALSGIGGLDGTYAIARQHVGVVTGVFEMGVSMQEVVDQIGERVDALEPTFPDNVGEPFLRRTDIGATPVLTLAVASDLDPLATRDLAERIVKPSLEQVEGVGAVTLQGGEEREVRILLDLPKMAELRIPLLQVAQLLGYDTRDIPGGTLQLGPANVSLRARGQVESLEELGSIVVQGFPQPIYLRDVARLEDGRKDLETIARVDGQRAVTLDVVKESGANTVAVVDGVREQLADLDLPAGVSVSPVTDGSRMARDMLHEMLRSLLAGAAMAVLVVFLFMVDWRSTVIAGVALPTSVVTTFFFMWLAAFSLNILTLVAMTLAIGILIDDAVVVQEVIHRHRQAGEAPTLAALAGTKEVALAVLATTLSILAVFVPVGFVGGLVGQFFTEFGLTIAIAVSVSLFIAFTVIPMLSARIGRTLPLEDRGRLARALLATWERLGERYRSALTWALDHGRAIAGVSAALFLTSLVMAALTGFEFMPRYDRSGFQVDLDLAPYTSLDAAEQVAADVEDRLRQIPEVRRIHTLVGPDGAADRIQMRVETVPKGERNRSVYEIQPDVRERLADLPGVVVAVRDPPLWEGMAVEDAVQVEIRGEDLSAMGPVAEVVRAGMRRIPGASDVTSTWRPLRPELALDVDREQAAAAGLSVGQAGIALRTAVAGQVVGTLADGDRFYDLRLLARPEDRTPETLLPCVLLLSPIPRLDDPWGRGTPVALQNVARLVWSSAPGTIERHERMRTLVVSCGVVGRALSNVEEDVRKLLAGIEMPEGVSTFVGGDVDLARDAMGSMLVALGLAVALVYAVLAAQFESFVHPLTIMLSLPLAIVGAVSTVFLAGWPVGIPTVLGVILLMGIVTKNAILLVDRALQGLREGCDPRQAMLEAGQVRLRPILMTSFAMILGMAPVALSQGSGSEIWQPLALPVIGGLVASTLLTLFVVPVAWLWVERVRARWKRAPVESRP